MRVAQRRRRGGDLVVLQEGGGGEEDRPDEVGQVVRIGADGGGVGRERPQREADGPEREQDTDPPAQGAGRPPGRAAVETTGCLRCQRDSHVTSVPSGRCQHLTGDERAEASAARRAPSPWGRPRTPLPSPVTIGRRGRSASGSVRRSRTSMAVGPWWRQPSDGRRARIGHHVGSPTGGARHGTGSARCGREGEGRAGHARDDRRARPGARRGGGRRQGLRRVPHRPALPRGRDQRRLPLPARATRPRGSWSRSGPTSPTWRRATSSS